MAATNQFAGLGFGNRLFNLLGNYTWVCNVTKVNIIRVNEIEMNMRIIETGNHKSALCINYFGKAFCDIFLDGFIRGDSNNCLTLESYRLGTRIVFIYSNDLGVPNHQLGRSPRDSFRSNTI